jgi:hypothetical protein
MELSREIAQLVHRALGGEAIDPAVAGESLARRFPHLSLPGELIGKAVARASSMVGVALPGSEAVIAPPAYPASETAFWYAHVPPGGGSGAVAMADIVPRGWFAPPSQAGTSLAGP